MRLKEKRICRKTEKLLNELAGLRHDFIMVECENFDYIDVGYDGRRLCVYKFEIELINSTTHNLETETIEGTIRESHLKRLPLILACEWYRERGRDRYLGLI